MKNLFMILAFCAFSLGGFAQDLALTDGYQVGSVVEDFKLKNVDETMFSLASLEDAKGAIVIFSCNTCPYIVATEERMIDLHKRFAPVGYPVVAINSNSVEVKPEDTFEEMQAHYKEMGFPFYYVKDETQEVAKNFGATRTPHVYLLEKQEAGMVVRYIGAIDDSTRDADAVEERFLEKAIRAVTTGQEPDPNFTKAIGCTIKWGE